MLEAILDFSACHYSCQFTPAVSDTTDYAEHFCYTTGFVIPGDRVLHFLALIVTLPHSMLSFKGYSERSFSGQFFCLFF